MNAFSIHLSQIVITVIFDSLNLIINGMLKKVSPELPLWHVSVQFVQIYARIKHFMIIIKNQVISREMARAYLREFAEEERQKQALIIKRRNLRDTSDPFSMPEDQFVDNYRLTKEVMSQLCHELNPLLPEKIKRHAIPPELAILAAVAFMACGSYQRNVGRDFELGLSQPSVSNCLADVVDALNSAPMVQRHIQFPSTQRERLQLTRRFMQLHCIPGVLGCIDGTHVALVRPKENEEAYFNRKNYHSLNVLIICDGDLEILHVDASFGGASHDSHIWNSSPVQAHIQSLHEQGEACWLLGDSGYAQREYLMTPVLGAAPNSPEDHYTQMHCSARNTVERCIGVLKARWRCLLRHRTLHYDPIKSGKIVNACVILHNMANEAGIDVPDLNEEERRALQEGQIDPAPIREELPRGREALIERLWRSRE